MFMFEYQPPEPHGTKNIPQCEFRVQLKRGGGERTKSLETGIFKGYEYEEKMRRIHQRC